MAAGSAPAETPALLLLPRLAKAPADGIRLTDAKGDTVGVVDAAAMLRGLDRLLGTDSGDVSWVEARVARAEYSASAVARAVEDADANLLEMLTSADPADPRMLRLSLKVSHSDPGGVVRSLERYGIEASGVSYMPGADFERARRNLSELELYLNM